jgi:hypothetical protein
MNGMYFQGNKTRHSSTELELFGEHANYFDNSSVPTTNKLRDFCKYVRRQDLARFLAKHQLFTMQLHVTGSIVECGAYLGGGTLTFAQLSAIYEPYNHTRKVICFDSFEGLPTVSDHDRSSLGNPKAGDLSTFRGVEEEISEAIRLFDKNRPVSHIPKVEMVKGDACKTVPEYLRDNPHLVISMLYLDFDLYEPTKLALTELLPRIPQGGVLAFDELNCAQYPGETMATMQTVGISNLGLRKTIFDPWISYAIMK